MADSPRRRYSPSPSPGRARYKSRSRSRSRSRSPRNHRGKESNNPGNNLYVTGLSTRVTEKDLQEYFSSKGKVVECCLVTDPLTRESRGFGFVTMSSVDDAERCIKYLNKSNLEGRTITVEKAKRKRARTPTPGKYLGVRSAREAPFKRRGGYDRGGHGGRQPYQGRRNSPYNGGGGGFRRERSFSPAYSPYRSPRRARHYYSRSRSRSRSPSPYYYK